MAIVFSVAGRSDLTLERGRIVPYVPLEYRINQDLNFTEADNPKVVDYGSNAKFIKLAFIHLTSDNYNGLVNGLETWFSSTEINWAKNNFTMTDEDTVAHTVRLWQKQWSVSRDPGGRYSVGLVLLKE
jgi:hypothetical protein